ncbi:hypothetical protein J6590_072965 [Homalodisca vitripennis]|nr:hypothetical protein J6590_072965 [Homalodisca vitripennis]
MTISTEASTTDTAKYSMKRQLYRSDSNTTTETDDDINRKQAPLTLLNIACQLYRSDSNTTTETDDDINRKQAPLTLLNIACQLYRSDSTQQLKLMTISTGSKYH